MKINREKNAKRNIVFGSILKLNQVVIPFIMRTVMLYVMGVEYLGLNSLFISVIQVLNLAELGVGSAMIYSMYKPIVDDDTKSICALMRLYKLYYRAIGCIVLISGLIIYPFIPYMIKGNVPEGINIHILYLLNLGAAVLSYWLFAYKNSLLQAHQRTDILSKITIIANLIQYIIQFAVIIFLKNYYIYVTVSLVIQAVINISAAFVSDKMYPNYKAVGKLPKKEVKKINKRVRDLFSSKIAVVVINYSDTAVISAFLGLTSLAVYQNYYFIIVAVRGFINIIFQSCTAGIGNSIITETPQKNYVDLKKFTLIIARITGFCTCCLLCLFQPFMKIWAGEQHLLDFPIVICFCMYFFVYSFEQLLNVYKDAAGIWNKDKFRTLATSLANLILNLILVNFTGLFGVIFSTILSFLLVGMPWLIYNLFTEVFKRNAKEYICLLVKYAVVTVMVASVTYLICNMINDTGIISLILKFAVCFAVSNILFALIYLKRKKDKI